MFQHVGWVEQATAKPNKILITHAPPYVNKCPIVGARFPRPTSWETQLQELSDGCASLLSESRIQQMTQKTRITKQSSH